ncbi:DUF1330 domain-containing protein [Vibrio sp. JC009]|uniref:DUF1330 domain-containing protein n=1 Tax=Vibrio sp. JC009 TaxID=2912314 RepID=UPI0023B0BC65|nr:DUF1330 domain-containing protein [Vibrio sp. JC009]WED23809.1 DUF1330 domain-containing protein [Vibrio sp. JC009]
MQPTYVYIQFKIKDMQAFKRYTEQVSETTKIYGGKTIAVNKAPSAIHGEVGADVCVIQEWPSLEATQTWHDSPEYAPVKKLRDEEAMSDLKIIPIPALG